MTRFFCFLSFELIKISRLSLNAKQITGRVANFLRVDMLLYGYLIV